MFFLMAFSVVVAYFAKGLSGFANTLIFSTIMSFAVPNSDISPIELILGSPSNWAIIWKERKSIHVKLWLPVALMMMVGAIPGMLLLKNGSPQTIKAIFGATVVLLGVEMLLRELSTKKQKPNRFAQAAIGLLAGAMCGLYGIGALLAAYFSRTTEDAASFRGNLCMVFLTENIYRTIAYAYLGILTVDVLWTVLKLAPFMLLGLFLGMKCAGRIREATVRRIIIALLIFSGLSLLLLNL